MSITRLPFFFFLLFCLSFSFFSTSFVSSYETVVSTLFDAQTIAKGYTLSSSDNLMRLGIRPDTLNVSTQVDIKTLAPELMQDTYPANRTLIGNVYLFDILNKSSYDGSDFFFLEILYPEEDSYKTHGRRRIYFYNAVSNVWEELPSEDHADLQSVRALIHLPYARLAIFEEIIP